MEIIVFYTAYERIARGFNMTTSLRSGLLYTSVSPDLITFYSAKKSFRLAAFTCSNPNKMSGGDNSDSFYLKTELQL
jgi:hypothetical protein